MDEPRNPDPNLDDSFFAPWNWSVTEQIGCLIMLMCFGFAAALFVLAIHQSLR